MGFEEIKALLKDKRLVYGTDRVVKLLRNGKVDKLFMASNVAPDVKDSLEHYAKLSDTKTEMLGFPNDELGTMCKKPFSVSVIGIQK
ncbi:MAG: ribosomal L7Ae/L30e/S12e/Gadd45 family protein [Candidatus Woesearchaeota archaeon]